MATKKSVPDLTVVIPAYNEENRLEPTLEALRVFFGKRRVEVLVVDDGSTDSTAALAEAFSKKWKNLKLIRQPGNRGKGAAIARGVMEARGARILFSDADLSTPIEELNQLEAKLAEGFDMAIGSRAMARSNIVKRQPLYRHWGGKAFNKAVRVLAVAGYSDTQCGFKMFTREAGRRLFKLQCIPGFGFDVELLFLARKYGLKVVEVAVRWVNSEETKVTTADAIRTFGDLVAIRWHDLAGRYIEPPD